MSTEVGADQPAGDLLGRPVRLELLGDQRLQPQIRREQAGLRPLGVAPGPVIGPHRSIAPPATVTPDLPADRGRRATEPAGDPADGLAVSQPARDLLALGQCERPRRSRPLRRHDPAAGLDDPVDGSGVSAQRSPELAERLTLLPASPHVLLLGEGQSWATHLGHAFTSGDNTDVTALHSPVELTLLCFANSIAVVFKSQAQRSNS